MNLLEDFLSKYSKVGLYTLYYFKKLKKEWLNLKKMVILQKWALVLEHILYL